MVKNSAGVRKMGKSRSDEIIIEVSTIISYKSRRDDLIFLSSLWDFCGSPCCIAIIISAFQACHLWGRRLYLRNDENYFFNKNYCKILIMRIYKSGMQSYTTEIWKTNAKGLLQKLRYNLLNKVQNAQECNATTASCMFCCVAHKNKKIKTLLN